MKNRRDKGRAKKRRDWGGVSLSAAAFGDLVREAFESLPEALRARIENVAILVEEETGPDSNGILEEDGELLGLYHGVPQTDRGFGYGNVLPDRIVIYQRPLERISRNLDELRENIRQTVVHEVGHYLGFDEAQLAELEGRMIRPPSRD